MLSGRVVRGWGGGVVVSEFFDTESNFLFIFFGGGGGVFFYKLTRNPNLTKKNIFFLGRGRGGGTGWGWMEEGKCKCMSKCFKWQFYSSRRTPVQNYFEIHAYM